MSDTRSMAFDRVMAVAITDFHALVLSGVTGVARRVYQFVSESTPDELIGQIVPFVPIEIKKHFGDGFEHQLGDWQRLANLQNNHSPGKGDTVYVGVSIPVDGVSTEVAVYAGSATKFGHRRAQHQWADYRRKESTKRWYKLIDDAIHPRSVDVLKLWQRPASPDGAALTMFVESLFMYSLGSRAGNHVVKSQTFWAILLGGVPVDESLRANVKDPLTEYHPYDPGNLVTAEELGSVRATHEQKQRAYHDDPESALGKEYREWLDWDLEKQKQRHAIQKEAFERDPESYYGKQYRHKLDHMAEYLPALRRAFEKDPESEQGQLFRRQMDMANTRTMAKRNEMKEAFERDPESELGVEYTQYYQNMGDRMKAMIAAWNEDPNSDKGKVWDRQLQRMSDRQAEQRRIVNEQPDSEEAKTFKGRFEKKNEQTCAALKRKRQAAKDDPDSKDGKDFLRLNARRNAQRRIKNAKSKGLPPPKEALDILEANKATRKVTQRAPAKPAPKKRKQEETTDPSEEEADSDEDNASEEDTSEEE